MRYLIILFLAGYILTSCEKVIDLDLDGAEKKYVIEGYITDQAGQCHVTITRTGDLDQNNQFPPVSGALVSITDNSTGITTPLSETSPGVYTHASLSGTIGNTYTLQTTINGNVFTASSTIPQLVDMDTIYVSTENWFDGLIKLANVEYDDPAGVINYYRFMRYRNGIKTKEVFINNDDLTDGRRTTTTLFVSPDDSEEDVLKTGDTVKVEMLCIDARVYKYWHSLEQSSTGDPQSAAPANPVTNISGGALGYFSAHTFQAKTMVVP